ncbi:MAG: ComEC/Rec2 family competence protein [Planctomycetota bacterium]|nr:MAG: ComEC/Rec2 family competence protein [Planctomycetota bacterium]
MPSPAPPATVFSWNRWRSAASAGGKGDGGSGGDARGLLPQDRFRLPEILYRYPLVWAALLAISSGRLAWHFQLTHPTALWLCAGTAVAAVVASMRWASRPRFSMGCAAVAIAAFGAWYGGRSVPPSSDDLSRWASRGATPVAMRGVVAGAAQWRPNPNYRDGDEPGSAWVTEWDFLCTALQDGGKWSSAAGRLSIRCVGRVTAILPGDRLQVHGDLSRIDPPTNPGGFDFAAYNRRQGKFTRLRADSPSQFSRLGVDSRWWWSRQRARVVRWVDQNLHRRVIWQQAPLAAALVIGQRQQVDWEDQQELMATGTLHMLAISGMHVEIVAWAVLVACTLMRLEGSGRFALIATICLFYALLADAKPPVVRAVVLVIAFEYARLLGRRTRLSNLLGLAALLLFLMRVTYVDEVGVQLSFLAVAAIGVFVLTPGDAVLRWLPAPVLAPAADRSLLRSLGRQVGSAAQSMLRLSFWVWLVTCPLVWTHFHVLAPIAIPLNVLVALPLALSLIAGLLTGVLGWCPIVAHASGAVCGSGLWAIGQLVAAAADIPGGHWWLPAPPLWWTLVFYAVIVVHLLVRGTRGRRELAIGLVAWVCLGAGLFAWGPRGFWGGKNPLSSESPGACNVTFLDVGHGTAVVIEKPDGGVWLYDAGRLGAAGQSYRDIAAALWAMHVARIERVIISHADADHYNAVVGLADRFVIAHVSSTPQFWESSDPWVRQVHTALDKRAIPRDTWWAGTQGGVSDDFRWRVLHPPAHFDPANDNAASLCLLLESRNKRVLLPGDLEGDGLLELIELPPRPCHVLMAPHHGSLTVDPRPLIQWCQPDWIVISGGHRAGRAEVARHYRGARHGLAVTFSDGATRCQIDPNGKLHVRHWATGGWRPLPSEGSSLPPQ